MSSRHLVPVAFAAIAGVAAPRAAEAQHCHVPADVPPARGHDHGHHDHHHGHHAEAPRPWWLVLSTSLVAGSADRLDTRVGYQGASLAVDAGWRRFAARVALPAYRVDDEGVGLGDLLLGASADVLPSRAPVRGGVVASVSAPTGDADAGRGMGHSMIAAGAWARLARGRWAVTAGAVYAQALGDGAEHAAHGHGAMSWPLVDPMNPREVIADATGTFAVVPGRARAGIAMTYAVPVVDGGETRLVPALVGELARGTLALRARAGVPVVGDPYVARGVVELAVRY